MEHHHGTSPSTVPNMKGECEMKVRMCFPLFVAVVSTMSVSPTFANWQFDGGVIVETTPSPVRTTHGSASAGYSNSAMSVSAGATSFWPPAEEEITGWSSANVDVYYRQNYKWVGGGTPANFNVTTSGSVSGSASDIGNPAPIGATAGSASSVSTIGGIPSGGAGPSAGGYAYPGYNIPIPSGPYTLVNYSGTAYITLRLKSSASASQGVAGTSYSGSSAASLSAPSP